MILAVAGFGCTPETTPSGTVDPTGDDTETPDSGTPTPPPNVLPMAEALAGRCPDVVGGPKVTPGDDLRQVTLAGAGRCNDGSPPVMFVRAATDPAHAADWVVHLEGGGLCRDHEECAARWCGEGPVYDAGNMSSAWSPPTARGTGIASADPENDFAGWNQVEVHYCSSDFWIGTNPAAVLDDADPPYSLRFEGSVIVGDALDALGAGAVSDDGTEALPPLGDAARVVFGGSSSGGWGVILNVGRMVAAAPAAAVVLAPDSGFSPSTLAVSPDQAAGLDGFVTDFWTLYGEPLWHGVLPEACTATHTDTPALCLDVDRVLREYVDVPIALHHALYDPVLYEFVGPLGFTTDDYAVASADTLRLYADTVPGIGIHGPSCRAHTSMDSDAAFADELVTDAVNGGAPASLHKVVAAAVEGASVVAIDTPAGLGSICVE